jgi:hypothetical protein
MYISPPHFGGEFYEGGRKEEVMGNDRVRVGGSLSTLHSVLPGKETEPGIVCHPTLTSKEKTMHSWGHFYNL